MTTTKLQKEYQENIKKLMGIWGVSKNEVESILANEINQWDLDPKSYQELGIKQGLTIENLNYEAKTQLAMEA